MNGQKRIVWVDYMRCLGLLLVIGAHVFGTSTPELQLLFGCNVAIMIVVSGYCSVRSSECSVIKYYKKRGIQMIVHPWIFFIIYFILVALLNIGKRFPYTTKQIIKTFLFLDGIGYTWIIAVFIITASVTPIIRLLFEKIPQIKWGFPIAYWCVGLLFFALHANNSLVKVLLYVTGYVFLTFIGFSTYKDWKQKRVYFIGGIFVLLCSIAILLSKQEDIFDLSGNKYPPTVYYITYGMTVSIALMSLLSRTEDKLSKWQVSKHITKISSLSFDIYLWHIFGLYIASRIENVWVKYLIVTVIAVLGAVIYNKTKLALTKKRYRVGV